MKGKLKLLLPCLLIACLAFGTGCEKKEAADDYLGRLITRAKENEGELSAVLEDGLSDVKSTENIAIDFPEELKEPYETFLMEALNQVQFELNKAEETGKNTYSVRVTYEPVDIAALTEETNFEYAKNISSTDFCAEAKGLLEQDTELLAGATKQQKKSRTITVTKDGDKFSIEEDEMKALFEDALQGYMAPYTSVAKVFDMRDYLQAYLDATLKGETERYQLHTGSTAEEAASWYEDSFSGYRMDELSDEQNERLKNAAKEIYRNCQYTVGVVKQNTLTEYVLEVTTTPNTSLLSAASEYESGTYYSVSESINGLLNAYDKYAAAPTYGAETSITVTWNAMDLMWMNNQTDNEEYNRLMETIIPTE